MTNKLYALCLLTLSSFSAASAQVSPDVGSAVVKFLLGNPKRADKMSTDQRVALEILADLFTTEGQRQHQLNYAAAGRNQITISTQGGGQAQLVRNEAGSAFLLIDGVIYPIAAELVKQAQPVAPRSGLPRSVRRESPEVIATDPREGKYQYAVSDRGTLLRLDSTSAMEREIGPDFPDRRLPRTPVIGFDSSGALYLGTQRVHVSRDKGETWGTISPDLTRNEGDATRSVLSVISVNPFDARLLWVGSGDGLVFVTPDGGRTWTNVTPPELVRGTEPEVVSIETSLKSRCDLVLAWRDAAKEPNKILKLATNDCGRSWRSVGS